MARILNPRVPGVSVKLGVSFKEMASLVITAAAGVLALFLSPACGAPTSLPIQTSAAHAHWNGVNSLRGAVGLPRFSHQAVTHLLDSYSGTSLAPEAILRAATLAATTHAAAHWLQHGKDAVGALSDDDRFLLSKGVAQLKAAPLELAASRLQRVEEAGQTKGLRDAAASIKELIELPDSRERIAAVLGRFFDAQAASNGDALETGEVAGLRAAATVAGRLAPVRPVRLLPPAKLHTERNEGVDLDAVARAPITSTLFYPFGQNTQADEGGWLYLMYGFEALVRGYFADGSSRLFNVRSAKLGNVHDGYLPPEVVSYTDTPTHGAPEAAAARLAEFNGRPRQISRRSRTQEIAEGKPWFDWIEGSMRFDSKAVDDRAAIYGFLLSLFRANLIDPQFRGNRWLSEIPFGARPDDKAVAAIINRMAWRWDKLGLASRHGSFDFWLVMAAMSESHSAVTLRQRAKMIASLPRPEAWFFLAQLMALHLRNSPGHPLEDFGEPGAMEVGFVDVANLVDILPQVISRYVDDPRPMKPHPEEGDLVPERAYHLWVIATALDPAVYLEEFGRERWKRFFGYRRKLMDRLKREVPADKLRALFDELLRVDWASFGLAEPWAAADSRQASDNYNRNLLVSRHFDDSRPIAEFNKESRNEGSLQDPRLVNALWGGYARFRMGDDYGLPTTSSGRRSNYLEALGHDREFVGKSRSPSR